MSKYNKYIQLIKRKHQDRYGFIDTKHCDSLLFTGLLGCVPEIEVYIKAAFDNDKGMWHRRPLDKPCFDCKNNKDVGSKSTISRDMLIGLAWYCWFNKRGDIVSQVVDYAVKNFGFMGCGAIGAINIMPPLFATFCWMDHKLNGTNWWLTRKMPADLGNKTEGYESHLQVLHILLRSEIVGKLSKSEKKVIAYQAKRQPNNPLFVYANGDKEKALELLDNGKYWPKQRLPNTQDRKEGWLFQRDEGPDWQAHPDGRKEEHHGGDYLFLYWLINR